MFGGLLYPSMAVRANADNLALKQECVDNHLSIRKVEYIRVDDADTSGFRVTILDILPILLTRMGAFSGKGVSLTGS